jgi:hypothetical protein
MPDPVGTVPGTAVYAGPSAEAWFAGGERVGYDSEARAIVHAPGAALNVFVKREGDIAHAVSFLPGFPDGSFGWAKVLPHLPNAAAMPKLFVEYLGMGNSDKPHNFALFHGRTHRSPRGHLARLFRSVHNAGRLRLFLACRFGALAAPA